MLRVDVSYLPQHCWTSTGPLGIRDAWGFFCSGVAAPRSQCFNARNGHQGRNPGADWHGRTRDVARTYREALRRERKDLPAYNNALSVYLGHFPTMGHDAGRQAVAEIIATDFRDRDRAN